LLLENSARTAANISLSEEDRGPPLVHFFEFFTNVRAANFSGGPECRRTRRSTLHQSRQTHLCVNISKGVTT
jgi:hypothetical protein